MEEQQLTDHTEPLEVNGISGTYVELLGETTAQPTTAIVGWIGLAADQSWFVKMAGDPELVVSQRQAFRGFLDSLRF